jgi:serine/threonine protein kinase
MKTLEGTTLKKQYFLRELAGRGGMADVYLAWDSLRATKMAVKILRRDLANNKKFYQAFEKEAGLLEELQHPYIVRLYEFAREKDVLFIVMAWIDGMDLKKRIVNNKRPISLADAARILEPICSALNFAHQKGAFHCDIKPSNILLHENARDSFLADFGVARVAQEQGGGGTLPYMAPEQFAKEKVSAQTDIYALGITLYEMLSGGILPYRGETSSPGPTVRERFAYEHIYVPLPSITQFNSSISQSIVAVLQKALSKKRSDRFRSTLDFYNAFEQARADVRVPDSEQKTVFLEKAVSIPPPVVQAVISDPMTSSQNARGVNIKRGEPHLFVRSGERIGQSVAVPSQTPLTIGRGTTCMFRLQERSISRLHATVFLTKRGLYIRDEDSSLGTFLNNQRIPVNKPVALKEGDVVQIGHYQIFEIRIK